MSGHHSQRDARSLVRDPDGRSWAKEKGGVLTALTRLLPTELGEHLVFTSIPQGCHTRPAQHEPDADPRFHVRGSDVDMQQQGALGRSEPRGGCKACNRRMEIRPCPRRRMLKPLAILISRDTTGPSFGRSCDEPTSSIATVGRW
jgi:hypothetical protein